MILLVSWYCRWAVNTKLFTGVKMKALIALMRFFLQICRLWLRTTDLFGRALLPSELEQRRRRKTCGPSFARLSSSLHTKTFFVHEELREALYDVENAQETLMYISFHLSWRHGSVLARERCWNGTMKCIIYVDKESFRKRNEWWQGFKLGR
jgi:hypothetical protein